MQRYPHNPILQEEVISYKDLKVLLLHRDTPLMQGDCTSEPYVCVAGYIVGDYMKTTPDSSSPVTDVEAISVLGGRDKAELQTCFVNEENKDPSIFGRSERAEKYDFTIGGHQL